MSADRSLRKLTDREPRAATPFVPRTPEVIAAEAARKDAEAARERVLRDARVREEEREALRKRLEKMSPDARRAFLEEERLLTWGRGIVARLKKAPPEPLPEWATELFGVVDV